MSNLNLQRDSLFWILPSGEIRAIPDAYHEYYVREHKQDFGISENKDSEDYEGGLTGEVLRMGAVRLFVHADSEMLYAQLDVHQPETIANLRNFVEQYSLEKYTVELETLEGKPARFVSASSLFENYWVPPNGLLVPCDNHGKFVLANPQMFNLETLQEGLGNYEYSKMAMAQGAIRFTIMAGDIVMVEYDAARPELISKIKDVLFELGRQDSTIELSDYNNHNDHRVYRGVDDLENMRTAQFEDWADFQSQPTLPITPASPAKPAEPEEPRPDAELWRRHHDNSNIYYFVSPDNKAEAIKELGEKAVARQESGKGSWVIPYDAKAFTSKYGRQDRKSVV